MSRAKAGGKYVHAFFHAGWSSWSRDIEADVYGDKAVMEFLSEDFVNLRIDVENQSARSALNGDVQDAPVVWILDPEASPKDRLLVQIGQYCLAPDFISRLKRVKPEHERLKKARVAFSERREDPAVCVELGLAALNFDRMGEAEPCLEFALRCQADRSSPVALDAMWGLAVINSGNRPRESRVMLDRLLIADSGNRGGRADNALLLKLRLTTDLSTAEVRSALQNIVERYPGTDGAFEAMFLLAASFANRDGEFAMARHWLERLAKETPDGVWAPRVKLALGVLERNEQGAAAGERKR
ncbi:MAG: hypothetical protein FD180_1459 [Planctomycetota bacterium]|nr:MAG: hypothetical protein FD180_1459 [Planctomycetota bacterium]